MGIDVVAPVSLEHHHVVAMSRVRAVRRRAPVHAALEQGADGSIALVGDEDRVGLPSLHQLIRVGGSIEGLLQPFERRGLYDGVAEVEAAAPRVSHHCR
jgi:hypothetical protein